MSSAPRSYGNRLRQRLRGRRFLIARRVLAAALLIAAAAFAIRPGAAPPTAPEQSEARAGPDVPLVDGPGFSTVPIHLADGSVAALLTRGTRVDVVTVEDGARARRVLASMATVVDIRSPPGGASRLLGAENKGPLVLISVPTEVATEVAALSLRNPVAVTLR